MIRVNDTTAVERYRLVVTLGQFDVVFGDKTYACYEEAQSRVASAVQHFGPRADVCAVKVQRGVALSAAEVDFAELGRDDCVWGWRTERRWGPAVIARILRQQGDVGARRLGADDPMLVAPPAPRPVGEAAPVAASPPAPAHKQHGWHFAAMVAFLAIAWIGLLALQTGGQIGSLLEGSSAAATPTLAIPDNPAQVRPPAPAPSRSVELSRLK